MGRIRRTYTPEFKSEAVKMISERGHRISQVARDLDLDPKLIRRWRAALEQEGDGAFPGRGRLKPEDEEMRRLRREVERLREEREILKKALAIFSGPRQS